MAATSVSAEEAVQLVRPGQRIFIGSGAAEPQALVTALAARSAELHGNEIVHILTLGVAPYCDPDYTAAFRHNAPISRSRLRTPASRVYPRTTWRSASGVN